LDRDDDAVVDFCVDLAIKFLIEICPDKNFKQISVTLSSETDRSWGRPLVLDGLFSCFSFFRLKSPEGYKELTTEVMQLPVTILRGKDKEPRIPLDQSLLILVKCVRRAPPPPHARAMRAQKELAAAARQRPPRARAEGERPRERSERKNN
jgi:hypothetical protein